MSTVLNEYKIKPKIELYFMLIISLQLSTIADINTDFVTAKCAKSVEPDAHFSIINEFSPPTIRISQREVYAVGDFMSLEREVADPRFSLLGNEGLFFRFVLRILEQKHGIFSLHACSLSDPKTNRLLIVCGGASSGKTPSLLAGIEAGWQVFATEMTHFHFDDKDLVFYKGAVLDNIRIGTLRYDFPGLSQRLKVKLPVVKDEWGTKVVVDLSPYQAPTSRLTNPEVTIVIPHIERGIREPMVTPVRNKRSLRKLLFDNASEKLAETVLLYEKIPFTGLDNFSASQGRLRAVQGLVDYRGLRKTVRIISETKNCLKEVE